MAQKANVKLVDAGGIINPVTGGVGQAVDGQTVAAGDKVLLVHPPNGDAYAGPWVAASGAWTRATDWDDPAEIALGDEWYVEDGTEYTGTKWHFDDSAVPTSLNTDLLTISQLTRRRALAKGSGINISGTTPPVISWTAPSDVESTFIEGLEIEWLSANSIRVKNGAVYIPTSGVADIDTDLDLTGLTLTGSTWYYLYAYDAGGGVLAVDPPSTQAPVTTPYRGKARAKGPDVGSDLTRRYIGAVYATAANTMRRFVNLPNSFTKWLVSQDGGARVFNRTTTLQTATDDSITALCPPTADAVFVSGFVVNSTASTLYISSVDDGLIASGVVGPTVGQLAIGPTASGGPRIQGSGPIALGATKSLRSGQSAANGVSSSGDVLGYWAGR